jgi:hypothetical protein
MASSRLVLLLRVVEKLLTSADKKVSIGPDLFLKAALTLPIANRAGSCHCLDGKKPCYSF